MNYLDEQIQKSKEAFKDFVATYKNLGDIKTLDWKNKSGSNEFYIRYVFDDANNEMYISGSVGTAVIGFSVFAKGYGRSYFVDNIITSTYKYYFDVEQFKNDVFDNLKFCLDEDLFDKISEIEENNSNVNIEDDRLDKILCFVEDLSHNLHDTKGMICRNDEYEPDWRDELEKIDPSWSDWIDSCGRQIHPNVIMWIVGLEMAWCQIYGGE